MALDLPDKLWQSANGITAFVVLQAIGYLYVSAEQHIQYALHKSQDEILIGVLVFHCLYAFIVQRCHKRYQSLVDPNNGLIDNKFEAEEAIRLSNSTMRVQIGAILAFGLFAALVTFHIDWNAYCQSYVSQIHEKVSCEKLKVQPSVANTIEEWMKSHLTSR